LLVVLQSLLILKTILVEFIKTLLMILILFMISQLWDSELMKLLDRSSGLLETHGELTGVNLALSELSEESTTLPLKVIAHGLLP
jgi:hypothetical protein